MSSKGLHFYIEESKPEPKVNPKEAESHKKEQLEEEGDYYDALTEGHSHVMQYLLFALIEKEEEVDNKLTSSTLVFFAKEHYAP